MRHAPKFRAFLPLAAVLAALIVTRQARADGIAEWFGWGTPTTVTTGYAPGYGYYYYAPATAYRTLYSPVAVTSYRPVTACSACGGAAVTSYMPVTTYVQRPVLQAYTAYQPVYGAAPAPACAACATAHYPAAPACGCSSCGCSSCGCSSCGCSRPACSSCGGCASGACGAAVAPAAGPVYSAATNGAPTLSYMAPVSSTPYAPAQVYAGASPTYPVAASYATPAYGAPTTVTYPAQSYGTPTYVVPAAPTSGALSQTYTMPLSSGNAPISNSVVRPSTPTLAPPAPAASSADVAPALPGPVAPTPQPPASSNQMPPDFASPQGRQSETLKTFGEPTVPTPVPSKPIPDNRNPTPPGTSGSHPPIDPNSRTASSMPMLRPGSHSTAPLSTPWPIAKTTAVLMPVAPDDADGWHAVR
jgi:hypothetical protein